MGANLCTPLRPKPNGTKNGKPSEGSSSFTNMTKTKCSKIDHQNGKNTHNLKRKTELEVAKKKDCKAKKMTLEDWIEASPGLTPDHIRRGEFSPFKHSKKRVHPSSTQAGGSSIFEAKDSLTLHRLMMSNYDHEKAEAKTESLSLNESSSGKPVKRVTFKLPHTVIFYSPEEPETESREDQYSRTKDPYYFSDDWFYSSVEPFCIGDSFDISACPRLAVHTLPLVSVSSSFGM
ncbi:hypothetical protein L6164_032289 [Bauhinia variegata]|uniref:Uncharacterized protein n=1 Tax=Bauhinia variegata TaxID=167791 RepID=A0ACB9KNB7_BAUVA|nr:hypothetical protein L6164_032289 [Bauhinia variegata]